MEGRIGMLHFRVRAIGWGSAILALPLLFLPLFLNADTLSNMMVAQGFAQNSQSAGGIEGAWTTLFLNRDILNAASIEAGYPGTSDSTLQMWDGGVVAEKGAARYGVMDMRGGMAASSNGQYSNWGLSIMGLFAEQRYPASSWELTAGFFVGYGDFSIEYRGPSSVIPGSGFYSRFDSQFLGTGTLAGLRWPTASSISFFIRSGYFWFPATGSWHGDLAGKMSTTYFDLSAPFAQAGMDLKF
jgi:hypothetical protein